MFSQELLTNGELNHFSLKERMVEIGKRWHKLSQSHKDKYKKLVEELQIEYKAELEAWVKVRVIGKKNNLFLKCGPPRSSQEETLVHKACTRNLCIVFFKKNC